MKLFLSIILLKPDVKKDENIHKGGAQFLDNKIVILMPIEVTF